MTKLAAVAAFHQHSNQRQSTTTASKYQSAIGMNDVGPCEMRTTSLNTLTRLAEGVLWQLQHVKKPERV